MLDVGCFTIKVLLTKQLLLSVVDAELRYDSTHRIERCFEVISGCSS